MKRVNLRLKLIILAVCSLLSLAACGKTSSSVKDDGTSSFVVTDVHTTDTPTPTGEVAEDANKASEEAEDESLDTFSSDKADRSEDTNEEQEGTQVSEESEEVSSDAFISSELSEALEGIGSILEPDTSQTVDTVVVENMKEMPAASMVKVYETNAVTLAACFYAEEIQPSVYMRMENKSFGEDCMTPLDNLRYIRVLYFGFDGEIYIGELVVNQLIADDIIDIFKELFDARYPIEKMVLVDDYDADDNKSMAANNTSAFNYRVVDGTTKLSKHAYGLAIDINPLYNPYVRTIDGEEVVVPENGIEYADRSLENEYYINKGDVCYNAFIKRGFTWGGSWESSKDYQHFQKVFE